MIRRFSGPLLVAVIGAGLSAIIFATAPDIGPTPPDPEIPVLRTMLATPRTLQMTVAAHGAVVPGQESHLVAEVAGRVVAVAPSLVSGGFFDRGDILVEVERVDYEVALERSRAALGSAESELANAERAYRRQEELRQTQSVSESVRDEALNRLDIARAALREATARVTRAERDLERTRMTAPYDGRVRSERVDVGQFVSRGESIATLYSVDFAEVRLPVHDDDLAFLPISLAREGDGATMPKVLLRARFAGAEHTWEAEVVRTEGELDPRTRMVNLIAQVPRPYEPVSGAPPLTVGLFVEAEILGRRVDDVVVLPRAALQQGNRVYVVTGENRLAFRDVDVLRLTGETAYLQGGVVAGEAVCISTLESAIEGQRVRPIPQHGPAHSS